MVETGASPVARCSRTRSKEALENPVGRAMDTTSCRFHIHERATSWFTLPRRARLNPFRFVVTLALSYASCRSWPAF
eukprot:867984-Prorocentrum_minimum.AAC.1